MSKHWPAWWQINKIPIFIFLILLIHGAVLGLSDDEAYYWVLGQKPALSYAFHPPGVAWWIAGAQVLFGWIFGTHHSGLVRLPAAFSTAFIFSLVLNWLADLGLKPSRYLPVSLVLLSFSGFFALSWMMVPDIPLFLGWTLLFVSTWRCCYRSGGNVGIFFGAAILVISKYSGVLAIGSSFFSLLFWSRGKDRFRGVVSLALGALVGVIPTLIWNANHQWASILYQIHDRHVGDGFSVFRYFKFWGSQFLIAGPVILVFCFLIFRKAVFSKADPVYRFIAVWILPAFLVFGIQPLFSDFKPHWALVIWWPAAIGLAYSTIHKESGWIRFQKVYGLFWIGLIFVSCHFPVISLLTSRFQAQFNPTSDVTNDFYGWDHLAEFMKEKWGDDIFKYPVIGSRYQTGGQASFQLSGYTKVSFIPREAKELDEWPDLGVSDSQGPQWPKITRPILFVTDNRYQMPPEFRDTKCEKLGRMETYRLFLLVRWVELWKCGGI